MVRTRLWRSLSQAVLAGTAPDLELVAIVGSVAELPAAATWGPSSQARPFFSGRHPAGRPVACRANPGTSTARVTSQLIPSFALYDQTRKVATGTLTAVTRSASGVLTTSMMVAHRL